MDEQRRGTILPDEGNQTQGDGKDQETVEEREVKPRVGTKAGRGTILFLRKEEGGILKKEMKTLGVGE